MIDKNKTYKVKENGLVLRRILCTDRVTKTPYKVIATMIDALGKEQAVYYSEDELEEVKPERWVNVYWLSDEQKYRHLDVFTSEQNARRCGTNAKDRVYIGTRKLGDDE